MTDPIKPDWFERLPVWRDSLHETDQVGRTGYIDSAAKQLRGEGKTHQRGIAAVKLSENGELSNYKVLHFATHGLVVPSFPEHSALV